MTFKEMCQQVGKQHITVNVLSYGYTVRSIFDSYYEPFKNKRSFPFVLDWFDDDDYWLTCVGSLIFNNEEDEIFYQDENGEWYCDDPELFMRPSCDE